VAEIALVNRRVVAAGRPHLMAALSQVTDKMVPDESAGTENGELGHRILNRD
jgi:hypothetical protein